MYPLTVYYDASCPICASEIDAIKAHDTRDRLNLVDCSAQVMADTAPANSGIDRAALMQAIHARDADGNWLRGVDVFAAVYGAVGIDALARLWSSPRLRPVWQRLYPWIARNRQWLSRLGAPRVIAWAISLAARRRVTGSCQPR